MGFQSKSVVTGVIASVLMMSPAPAYAQPGAAERDEGLCRRAPAAIVLPPEQREVRRPSSAHTTVAPPPPAMAPPPPPPPPAAVVAEPGPDASDEIAVTGSRVERRDLSSSSPVTPAPSAEAPSSVAAGDGRAGSAFEPREPSEQPPKAGQLTAGDYDDLLNPELYARYVDAFLVKETLAGVPRVDTGRVLTIAVHDGAGRPVPFADVTLTCADGGRLTLATAADGAAIFFPELDRLGDRVSVSVSHEGRTTNAARSVSLAGQAGAQRQTITVERAARAVRRFDLALMIDTTGSMSDELEYLKSELESILADIERDHAGLDIRVAMVAYRDVGDDYVTLTFPFTSDVAALRADLAQRRAGGGGDYPEAVEQALARTVALDWRQDAVRSILFVADAPPHADDVVSSWRSAEVARAKRIHIVPVGASGVGPGAEYMMRAMAALTQSRYIFLTDDSGIGNPHAPPTVECYVVTRLDALIRRVLDSQISGRRVEPREGEIIRSVGVYENGRCVRAAPERRGRQ